MDSEAYLDSAFIIFDIAKIVIATGLGHAVRYALIKAGLLNNGQVSAKAA